MIGLFAVLLIGGLFDFELFACGCGRYCGVLFCFLFCMLLVLIGGLGFGFVFPWGWWLVFACYFV